MMSKLLRRIENVLLFLSVGSTFVMVFLTTGDVGGRYLINRPITGTFDITGNYLIVACVFMSMCYAYREGANVRLNLLVNRVPQKAKLAINYIAQTISFLYSVSLLIATIPPVFRTFTTNLTLSTIEFPLWPAYMMVPLGLFFMCLRMFLDFWEIKNGNSGLFKEGKAEIIA